MKNKFTWNFFIAVTLIFFLSSCNKEVFNSEFPYAVQVSQQRNFQDALSIKDYLSDIGLYPYIVCHQTDEEGTWFRVLLGSGNELDEMKIKKMNYEDNYLFSKAELVNYNALAPGLMHCQEDEYEDNELSAVKPEVSEAIYDVAKKFPLIHNFYVENLEVFSALESKEIADFKQAGSVEYDLPRGIAPWEILRNAECYAEAVYKDYLNGHSMTMDIVKLKDNHRLGDDIPSLFADKILEKKGKYEGSKDIIEIDGKLDWKGYKVKLETKSGTGNYLVLTDADSSYVAFCQSYDLEIKRLVYIMTEDHGDNGLVGYREFFNTFYTLPYGNSYGDSLFYFHLEKLDEKYAENHRGRAWAKNCAGNWLGKAYFYNADAGIWMYNLYNLGSEGRGERVFDQKFSPKQRAKQDSVGLFEDTYGYYTYGKRRHPKTKKRIKVPKDLHFAINRYICTLSNDGNAWLDERDLSKRAKIFQFNLEVIEEDE